MSSVISPTSNSSSGTSAPTPANALITSTGIGSGLDISAIVSSLTTAFGAAQTDQLTNQQNSLDSQVSAYGTFASALDTLQSTFAALETPDQLAGFDAVVADNKTASATTTSDAVAGQYSLQVNNLATAASLTSNPVASSSTAVGTGTLTISVGGASTNISIDSTDNTLAGIASAINSAPSNPGVTASVITTTDGARLVLTGSATGAANAIKVTQAGGDGGLSSLVYDPASGVKNLTQSQAAQDASFSINGFAGTSASNVVSSAISGVTITLLQPSAAATPTTLTVSPDTSAAQTSIDKFVTALNSTLSSIQTLTGYDPSTQTAGALNGNATLEAFQNQLQNILGQVTNGAGGVKSLTDLGITANADGSYSVDDTKLGNALNSSVSSVGNLLGGSNGIVTQIDNLIDGYTQPGGLLATINQGLETSLTNVSTQQTALAAQLSAYSARLTAEYNAMDTAVALLKQTQTYLNAEFNPSANAASGTSSSNTSLGSGTLGT
jgi:flagellar hook-associated protein 2